MRKTLAAIVAAIAFSLPGAARAIPILGPTGHYYDVIQVALDWDSARSAALGMSHLSLSGYLANISSSLENAFVASLLGGNVAWFGGNDVAVPDTWVWADGPEGSNGFWQGLADGSPISGAYTNWAPFDPNDVGGIQDAAVICATGVSPCINNQLGEWIDRQRSDTHFFVVEFGTNPQVPEPASIILLGAGLSGLALASRRRR